MRVMKFALAVFSLILPVLLTQPAYSQPQDPKKVEERREFMTMYRIMEVLDLDKATAEKIFEIRKSFRTQRQSLRASLQEDFQNLRKTLQDTPRGKENEKELSALLNQIRDKRKKLESLDDGLYTQVSQVLTVRRQAELILFLKDFHKEMRGFMPGGPGRPDGPAGPPAPPNPGPDH